MANKSGLNISHWILNTVTAIAMMFAGFTFRSFANKVDEMIIRQERTERDLLNLKYEVCGKHPELYDRLFKGQTRSLSQNMANRKIDFIYPGTEIE